MLEAPAVRIRDVILDAWAWLNYKPIMQNPRRPGGPLAELAGAWVPEEDLRRLAVYTVLAAYDSNQAGQLVAASSGDEGGLERRELGDATKLIDTVLGYVLGSEQTISVPGAEHAEDEDPPAGAVEAAQAQARLRAWAGKELLELRMQQTERTAVRSGDAVYTLAWEPSVQRVLLRSYDPGFFFPEWGDDGELDAAEFPSRVHFAWELPEDPARGVKARVRRITFDLGPITAATEPVIAKSGKPVRTLVAGADGEPALSVGDRADPETGRITRVHPWAPDRSSGMTCYLSDGEWLLDDLKGGHTVYSLPESKAAWRVRSDGEVLHRLDLRCDFLPVVHITNSVPETGEHWGRSALAGVLQALDDLAATDTDTSAATATTGAPVISVSGARIGVDRTTGQPKPVALSAGSVFQLADGGRMDVLNTAPQLAALREQSLHLIDRIAANSRITAAGLGTLDPTALPSGYALALALGPLDSLIGSMRLARRHKYTLLLRMAYRLHQAGRVWPPGETPEAVLVFGPHTPTDRAAILDEVIKAVTGGVLSLETGVRMLMDAGYPVEDAMAEVQRIQARAFDAAARLADATADSGAVRAFLGLPPAPGETGPSPLIPAPGAERGPVR
ncbi:hypothetical protein [Streptomyces sp. NPDC088925]|uniref:hypothetical protein n=1 Tax=Streptomyces sp. NPDC088925 TaxID=3365914 RepID=UPI003802B0DA